MVSEKCVIQFCGHQRNYAKFYKNGVNCLGEVYLDEEKLQNWEHIPLEFDKEMISTMQQSDQWIPYEELSIPAAYRGYFTIQGTPTDTFFQIEDWKKGIVIINGFNLGRYWDIGPQKTLYVPYPLLKEGRNEVIVFDVFKSADQITFTDKPDLGNFTVEDF